MSGAASRVGDTLRQSHRSAPLRLTARAANSKLMQYER
jgi:hypothetical protein